MDKEKANLSSSPSAENRLQHQKEFFRIQLQGEIPGSVSRAKDYSLYQSGRKEATFV
jgi:hypothetical protein